MSFSTGTCKHSNKDRCDFHRKQLMHVDGALGEQNRNTALGYGLQGRSSATECKFQHSRTEEPHRCMNCKAGEGHGSETDAL